MKAYAGRLHPLNDREINAGGSYVLYWMEASQRTRYNHALDYAISEANRLDVPPVVLFCLNPDYPEANQRHFRFLLDGIHDVAADLVERDIRFCVVSGETPRPLEPVIRDTALVVSDRGYLRHQRLWRKEVGMMAGCRMVEVESDVVVPVEIASDRREYAARTIRPKIERNLSGFLSPTEPVKPVRPRFSGAIEGEIHLSEFDLEKTEIDRSVPPVRNVVGGMREARRLLDHFLNTNLDSYAAERNDPLADATTEMSPYLHFGQISPIDIVISARRSRPVEHPGVETLTEELVVRRELARNYVWYTPDYDRYSSLPEWARRTLDEHRSDPRPHTYSLEQLQSASTHDPYWNAAMREMRETGRMRGYMRMYWGKKVLEWSDHPEVAYENLITMNNAWFLDGGDPNSWTNVGWIFGLHDRPWKERPIFGKVRYMNDRGLERKFDIDGYVQRYGDKDRSD